jgi:hypothetical protein
MPMTLPRNRSGIRSSTPAVSDRRGTVPAVEDVTGPDRLLLDRMVALLRKEGECRAVFDEDDTDGVEKFRALGRRAGRQLKWKIRTHATDPSRRDDRRIVVYVLVTEESPLRDQLTQVRMRKAMTLLNDVIGGTSQ